MIHGVGGAAWGSHGGRCRLSCSVVVWVRARLCCTSPAPESIVSRVFGCGVLRLLGTCFVVGLQRKALVQLSRVSRWPIKAGKPLCHPPAVTPLSTPVRLQALWQQSHGPPLQRACCC